MRASHSNRSLNYAHPFGKMKLREFRDALYYGVHVFLTLQTLFFSGCSR